LLVAVEQGRWFLISAGVSPGMVASSSLRLSAPRSVADGGEHMHWWMSREYLSVDNVVSTLVAITKVGVAVGVVRALEMGGFAAWALVSLRGTIYKLVRVHL
jgi:hypothetical protein